MRKILIFISLMSLIVLPGLAQAQNNAIPSMSGNLEIAEDIVVVDPQDSVQFLHLQKRPAASALRGPASERPTESSHDIVGLDAE